MQSKQWTFTINNYTDDEIRGLREYGGFEYVVWGKEVGESGTPHLQGYCEFGSRKRLQTLSRLSFFRRARMQAKYKSSTSKQASDYCKKDGDFEERGTLSTTLGQGKRNDLSEMQSKIDSGLPMAQIAQEHFSNFIRYNRGISMYADLRTQPRSWVPTVVIYWGLTGLGKSGRVWRDYPDLYCHSGDRWFDGYDAHHTVLFDDFTGSVFALSYLLRLLDRYPMRVPIKGGFRQWVPRRIFITSNFDPASWYSGASQEHHDALFRRFTEIVHMTERILFE